uniref:Uncharacterized protein n=1 Tax=Amphimedon queenslandica TaxID=400682 RepID=A0A1X7V110_AMPQE
MSCLCLCRAATSRAAPAGWSAGAAGGCGGGPPVSGGRPPASGGGPPATGGRPPATGGGRPATGGGPPAGGGGPLGNHSNCNQSSSCRYPGYAPSKMLITDPNAVEAYTRKLKQTLIYVNDESYCSCRDTFWVESFNHYLLTYLHKRIHFGTTTFRMRMNIAVMIGPNEPVEEVSICEVLDDEVDEDIFLDGDGVDELDDEQEDY